MQTREQMKWLDSEKLHWLYLKMQQTKINLSKKKQKKNTINNQDRLQNDCWCENIYFFSFAEVTIVRALFQFFMDI